MIAVRPAGLVVSPAALSFEDCARRAGAEPQEWRRDRVQNIIFVGLDVHKATISVAVARGERGGEVRNWGSVPHRADHIRKLV